MSAVDTSVAVAAFASWHERHRVARRAVQRARLIGHVAIETYAVLTRLPPPHRAPASLVLEFIEGSFPEPVLTLPARQHGRLLALTESAGILGGAVYDALVAAIAMNAGETLLTLDRRALPVYQAVGARVRLLS